MMSYFPKVLLVALSGVGSKCLCTILSEASQTHTVAVKPPEGFNQRRMSDGEYFNQRYGNAFYKDALRDKKIFGLDVIENRDMSVNSKFKVLNERPKQKNARSKDAKPQRKPDYKTIKRTLDFYPKLNKSNRPKYVPLERSKTVNREVSNDLIDTSRFDYEDDEQLLDIMPKVNREVRIEKPLDILMKPKTKSLKPRKKIVIRKFVKNTPSKTVKRTPKPSKLLELLKSSKLTPAEFLYLSQKANLEKRKGKLQARSISDNAEEESQRRSFISENSLRRHGLGHTEKGSQRRSYISDNLHGHSLGQRELEIGNYGPVEYEENQKMQFQIHGQEGPQSYRFGHDTGLGYNRQFRYEERDDYGVVKGRYGYYDQYGQLKIVNYMADPISGYHTDIDPLDPNNVAHVG